MCLHLQRVHKNDAPKDKKNNLKMEYMKRKIEATKEQREKLAKTFGTSSRNVAYALDYERNSELAMRIRQAALEMGCEQYEIEVTVIKKRVTPEKPVKVLDCRGNVTK